MDKIGEIDVTVRQIDTKYKTTLKVKLKGDDIDYVVTNTIRRTIFTDIPTYTFESLNISKNTTIYNNNILLLRLNNLPIKMENKHIYYKEIIDINNDSIIEEIEGDDIDDSHYNVDQSSLNELTMYLNKTNNLNNVINVTTDDCKFYMSGIEVDAPFDRPVIIVKLQQKQTIELTAITKLGTEKTSASKSAVSVCSYTEINDHEYELLVSSVGQHTEKQIIIIACYNIIKQLDDFQETIPQNTEKESTLILHDIDHTFGNIISTGMRKHKNIKAAGYNMPHPLIDEIHIQYTLTKGDIQNIIKDVVKYYKTIFTNILQSIKDN
jgi:DNA-directed RNA polymerase subunit L